MSLFFVDSGCDLGFDQIKKLGIESINLNYTINDKEMEFNSEFDYDKFYSKFKKGVCVNYIVHSFCPETFTGASYIPVTHIIYEFF